MVCQRPTDEDIDLRIEEEITGSQPVEQLDDIQVDNEEPTRVLKGGSTLPPTLKEEIVKFLKKNLDIFAWTHTDMEGIDAKLMYHCLNVDLSHPSKREKRRPLNP